MQEHEKTFWSLLLLGALIAIGKVLSSNEPITPRLFIGRVILGAGTAMVAGAALIWVPGLPVLGVVGLGAALGIAGHQAVELWLRRKGSSLLKGKGKHDTE
ncbi:MULTISPECIES: phage holin family protein [Serratia]|uniref:Phage holin family protein n=1 Tax=Serratia marcescens TaxID=615 RepID=A0ABD5BCA5_SERMA|nr:MULTISPECIES: phage holin family protein [Serratia]KKZ17977.1 holin [Serratia marcescens]MDK1710809.1 phage holin family protein [Serratia marcescens]MDQ9440063.1 phage holin family protein [Serratia marcescens]MDQ9477041.1 phage holin family protein [Serratia marcescens]MDQ9525618.1 phage holin family protein [Serratia marcescens]